MRYVSNRSPLVTVFLNHRILIFVLTILDLGSLFCFAFPLRKRTQSKNDTLADIAQDSSKLDFRVSFSYYRSS